MLHQNWMWMVSRVPILMLLYSFFLFMVLWTMEGTANHGESSRFLYYWLKSVETDSGKMLVWPLSHGDENCSTGPLSLGKAGNTGLCLDSVMLGLLCPFVFQKTGKKLQLTSMAEIRAILGKCLISPLSSPICSSRQTQMSKRAKVY